MWLAAYSRENNSNQYNYYPSNGYLPSHLISQAFLPPMLPYRNIRKIIAKSTRSPKDRDLQVPARRRTVSLSLSRIMVFEVVAKMWRGRRRETERERVAHADVVVVIVVAFIALSSPSSSFASAFRAILALSSSTASTPSFCVNSTCATIGKSRSHDSKINCRRRGSSCLFFFLTTAIIVLGGYHAQRHPVGRHR